ncbi:MAG: (2Fe-2S)-binding protein [Negativicutes bacterium]|nr:(2Fe-2S)-binding protein [Negativicutes bacterium]
MAYAINFTLNNKPVNMEVETKEILVDTLRERLGLTGTKKACGTGDCGACTVLLNGRAVRSCTLLTAMVDGKEVLTIEGLGNEENVHPIQQAFVDEGAIQCGYCTPGMILATKALLDRIPNPTTEEIKEALSGNLCRCTGYEKIIRAVEISARKLNG